MPLSPQRPAPVSGGIGRLHPGQVLQGYLKTMTSAQLADAIGMDRTKLDDILNLRGKVDSATAEKLGKFNGATPRSWLNLQENYDQGTTVGSITPPAPPNP